jgi:sporulation protein YlmC with PRC-barrel domain
MDIPVNAEVYAADGPCGRSTYIILNPMTRRVTHLVVKEKRFPHAEYLVPIDYVIEATPQLIRLRCTGHELKELEAFVETEFVSSNFPEYAGDPYMTWPYVIPEAEAVPVEHERIPPGELAIRRGAQVEASDGHVGQVDEFLVDPKNGHITHLVLREGHLWGQKDVTIPVSQIDRIEEDTVYLKLDKHSVEMLPTIPVRRDTK